MLVPLVSGMASLVLNPGGGASMGVWGQGFPPAGAAVYSVRQCLPPLVSGGRVSPNAGDVFAWGATLGGGDLTARSAVGIDARGDLLYAGSMSALPSDMAHALVSAGAVTPMEFDINPEWVQADTAPSPGGPLSAAVPYQNRPADQYPAAGHGTMWPCSPAPDRRFGQPAAAGPARWATSPGTDARFRARDRFRHRLATQASGLERGMQPTPK